MALENAYTSEKKNSVLFCEHDELSTTDAIFERCNRYSRSAKFNTTQLARKKLNEMTSYAAKCAP